MVDGGLQGELASSSPSTLKSDEPCARSAPVSAFKAFMFTEHAGEAREDVHMHRTAVIQNALEPEEAKLTLEARRLGTLACEVLRMVPVRQVVDGMHLNECRSGCWP